LPAAPTSGASTTAPLGFSATLAWKPERGRHVLTLVDREERVADAVTFVVK
jgi:hypothetical protein